MLRCAAFLDLFYHLVVVNVVLHIGATHFCGCAQRTDITRGQ